jgi:rubredoxin
MKSNKYIRCIRAVFLCLLLLNSTKVFAADDCGEGNHIFQTEIIDATDTEPGKITYVCENCGYTYSEEIAPYGHQFSEETIDADCENPGRIIYTCKNCGYTYEELAGSALGHDYRLYEETDPTETTEGERVYRCSRCGKESREKIPVLKKWDADQSVQEELPKEPLSETREQILSTPEDVSSGSTMPEDIVKVTREYDAVNFGDFMLGSLEIILLAAFLPGIVVYQRLIMWNKKRSDEYRKHHRRWKESV